MPKNPEAVVIVSIASFEYNGRKHKDHTIALAIEAPGVLSLHDAVASIGQHSDAAFIKTALIAGFQQCDVSRLLVDHGAQAAPPRKPMRAGK